MSGFVEFTRARPGRGRRGETVTILRRGYLAFSQDAFARLGSPRYVKYLIDEDERLIGFRSCEAGDPNAHAVGTRTHSASARILLGHLGVSLDEARRYELETGDGQPPYIDLKKPGVPVTSNRRKA